MRTADRHLILGLYRSGPSRDLLTTALDLDVTGLDTAYNYRGYASHRMLEELGSRLLDKFTISTKVGFFPDGHDLAPARLRKAVEETVRDLGREPDTILLHNPESSPAGFADACQALNEWCEEGLCDAWGVSSWDPRPLLGTSYEGLVPDVLMTRCGLTVPITVLDAADTLADALAPISRWGMAPFGGHTDNSVWTDVDTTMFLAPGQEAGRIEAGLAAAFRVPAVTRIAVGTSDGEHLAQLHNACRLDVNPAAIEQYRTLLHQAATVGTGPR